jgi:outer membrane protein OmpA-like peptidoglycan-associated protein
LNVYFDTAKFAIKPEVNAEIRRVAAIIKKEGFTRLIIEGHTDSKGGVDNQTLSNNRSKATSAALRKLLPKVSVKISGSAFKKPAASNKTPEGMALNRRSEVLVW